ncbi:STAND family AAA ATPase [Pseudomonas nunensis]|uniref:STAND family AAA ATPase n=1 Tax=Pseudomonas nunensis TaxID=2961896 RepID=UPI0025B154E1|nr:metallophosphoesterase [Pseudomonas nunensis]MDN3224056.1 metallophosphoesterase [Pseudomonas nunensis]
MTKLAVIHLSDIHIKSQNDSSLKKASIIASACFIDAREADECLIAITGDIAFSGSTEQYALAKKNLIDPIISALEKETGKPVYLSIVPGNHDCVLIPKNTVRETLIEAIVETPTKAEDELIVNACADAQSNFFHFTDNYLRPAEEKHSKLFWQQSFHVGDNCIRISSLNAAWMSRLDEQQGQLVYPVSRFEPQLASPANLHLALIHHPFNWYSQTAYQQLRKRLRLSCTAILSGHEHIGNIGSIEDQASGSSIFMESAALFPHEQGVDAGFSVYLFDLEKKEVTSRNYIVETSKVIMSEDVYTRNWSNETLIHGALNITPSFMTTLNDPGGNFTHSAKERLLLEDVFVWPDIKIWKDDDIRTQRSKPARKLIENIIDSQKIIIYGDEKAGKTTLLYSFYRELIAQGYAPVYLPLGDVSISGLKDVERRIDKAISTQYCNPESVRSLSKEKRILLLDDIDRIKSGIHTLPFILEHASKHFSGICISAASVFEITNLASSETTVALSEYDSFELMKFGLKLRHQLIKKWCSISAISSKPELDNRINEVESIVNSVIGKQLVPEHPIYLLILLQSSEQHRHGEIQNSGLSFYYQYLITKSLGEVGVKPKELDEHFNYLSILAWKFNDLQVKEIGKTELDLFNREFSNRYISVDLSERLTLLTRARLLTKRGDQYTFAYPYIYYFFIGRYLSKNLDNPNIRAWVEESCKKLYLRDRANAIMFLTHHVENRWVIDQVCQVLRDCFNEKHPIEFNGDTSFISDLVEKSSQLTLAPLDVDQNQDEVRELSDNINTNTKEVEGGDFDALSISSKWNLLHKTAEILGLILKNYYGSLERPHKQEMIKEVFDGPLRALRLLLEEIATDIPSFVNELKLAEQAANKRLSSEDAEKRVKRKVFNVLGWVATSVVASAGSFVSSDKLREDISAVVKSNDTNAYRLIEAASLFLRPGTLPIDSIRKLASDLDHNPYAFGILQTLGFTHMYMFHTDEPQKQALCSTLKISFEKAKTIEAKKR